MIQEIVRHFYDNNVAKINEIVRFIQTHFPRLWERPTVTNIEQGTAGGSLKITTGTMNETGVTTNTTDIVVKDWNTKANLASPDFTGIPTAPTVENATDTSTKIATTAFVYNAMAANEIKPNKVEELWDTTN